MNTSFIVASNISVRIGETFLFTGDSWTMNTGEHWAVLGPNGSGKSTLAKALAGKLSVVSGNITLHFGDTSKEPYPISQQEYIGYLSFDTHRSIIEKEDRKAEALSSMGQEYQGTNLSHLSTGEVRKVLIYKILAKKPKFLILDEPFEGLDRESKKLLINFIATLHLQETQIFLITHHLDELPPSITHVMMIKDGHIFKSGTRREVLSDEFIFSLFSLERKSQKPNMSFKKKSEEPLIEMSHVTVRFGDKTILDDINWTMKEGENWMISGPNGAGKSTLVKLILGENLQSFSNSVKIFGKERGSGESIWNIKRNIGYISSDLHFDYRESMSAYKVVLSGFFDSIGLYNPVSIEQKKIVEEWFIRLSIMDLKNRDFLSLSLGQQRMILIIRALIKSPKLLIFDEPCHGLDMNNRQNVLQIIDQSIQHGSNIIYITHHNKEQLPGITHTMVLENGKIIATGINSDS